MSRKYFCELTHLEFVPGHFDLILATTLFSGRPPHVLEACPFSICWWFWACLTWFTCCTSLLGRSWSPWSPAPWPETWSTCSPTTAAPGTRSSSSSPAPCHAPGARTRSSLWTTETTLTPFSTSVCHPWPWPATTTKLDSFNLILL